MAPKPAVAAKPAAAKPAAAKPAAKKAAATKAAPKTAAKETTAAKKKPQAHEVSRFVSRPKSFGIGQAVPYKRDISRFMRWPMFVTMQRKKRVLQRRLKAPPALNQFRTVLDRATRTELFKLLKKYAPETRKERRTRTRAAAAQKKNTTKKPISVVSGIQEVTRAIERKRAKLVVIAHDVDPIELVLWLPTLCRSQKIPYAIVKDRARLGEIIGQKTATVLALSAVRSEDETALKNIVKSVNARFASRSDLHRKQWSSLQLSLRSRASLRKRAAGRAGGVKADN